MNLTSVAMNHLLVGIFDFFIQIDVPQ